MTDPQLFGPATAALSRARRARNVFLQLTPGRAAGGAEQHDPSGALVGMPFAAKDVFDVRGTRTSAASRVFDRRHAAAKDSEAVRRVVAAGGMLIGKTTMSELAYSGVGVNERFGTPTISRGGRHYVIGGSSSGSAAAVHAGIVPFALASDTSGSARIPAAWTGQYGFRPSHGRYPTSGMTPLAPTLDTGGIIASSLDRVEIVDRVLSGEQASTAIEQVATFVIPHDDYLVRCDRAVLDRFHTDVARLRSTGQNVVQRRFESLDAAWSLHQLHVPIVESEAFAAFGRYLDEPGLLSSPVHRRLKRARARLQERSSSALYEAMPTLRREFTRELGSGLLLSPPVEIDAPTLDALCASPELHDEVNRRSLALTMILSYLDAPSLVVPTAAGETEPPSCVQLSGSAGRDREVLDMARRLTIA